MAEEVCSEDADENEPDLRASSAPSFLNEAVSTDGPTVPVSNPSRVILSRSEASENGSAASEESDRESARGHRDVEEKQRLCKDEDRTNSVSSRNSIMASRIDGGAEHDLSDENYSIESPDIVSILCGWTVRLSCAFPPGPLLCVDL